MQISSNNAASTFPVNHFSGLLLNPLIHGMGGWRVVVEGDSVDDTSLADFPFHIKTLQRSSKRTYISVRHVFLFNLTHASL